MVCVTFLMRLCPTAIAGLLFALILDLDLLDDSRIIQTMLVSFRLDETLYCKTKIHFCLFIELYDFDF